jgi:hypothetical protein
MASARTKQWDCDDFCLYDRRIMAVLLALLVITFAVPWLAFHKGNETLLADDSAGAFLRSMLQPLHAHPIDDL